MIIYPQNIEIMYSPKLKNLFTINGITNPKKNMKIIIDVFNLNINSKKHIKCKCDNCNKIFDKRFCDITKYIDNYNLENLLIQKTYCTNKDCKNKTLIESNLKKYGVENIAQLNSTKNKKKETNLKKYGVENVFQSEEIKNKIKNTSIEKYNVEHIAQSLIIKNKIKETNLKKYGVENVFQSEEVKNKIRNTTVEKYNVKYITQSPIIKNKIKETNLKKYGVENVFQSEEVKNKIRNTLINNYRVDHPMKSEEIKTKAVINSFKALYNNNNSISSKQQNYIHNIIGGELNYPIYETMFKLDIALLDKKIYIEYDGSGHDLGVRLGKFSYEQLKQKDVYREMHMKKLGWKIIRIISTNDKLPNENDLKILLNKYINYLLSTNHTWIYINFDNNTVCGNQICEKLNYQLKKIKK